MYTFICANGHLSHSAAKAPHGSCDCGGGAYRIVDASEANAAGVNLHDCVRTVKHPNGASLTLHARTGLAYDYRALVAYRRTDMAIKLRSNMHLRVV